MAYPSRERCREFLMKAGCPAEVVRHIEAVTDLAIEIAECAGADVALVVAGAMLHDIGRSRTRGVDHAVEGADILRGMGLQEEIIRIVERHIGSGITAEEAIDLGLPPRNYIPETLEEKIVAHADNLISDFTRQTIQEHVDHMISIGLPLQAERALVLHRELSKLCGFDLNRFVR